MSETQDPDEETYESLKRSLSQIGLFRRGSVVRRFMPCGKPSCVCAADPPRLHGPYYQWTRKVHGKTVTVRLSEQEADAIHEWIANGRQIDEILAAMEQLALRLTERTLRPTRNP